MFNKTKGKISNEGGFPERSLFENQRSPAGTRRQPKNKTKTTQKKREKQEEKIKKNKNKNKIKPISHNRLVAT